MGDAPTVAVLIIVAGRADHLRRTLNALAWQTSPPDDVVVVDLLPARRVVYSPCPSTVRWVDHPPTSSTSALPLASGRNLAAASTTADQLIFLDVDCLPAPDLVERYVGTLSAHPSALACGPVRYLGEDWRSAVDPDLASSAELDAASEHHPDRPRLAVGEIVQFDNYDCFWSLSFGTARAVWDHLGGFDPAFVGYGAEDTDFGRRARALGIPLVWFGGGVAYHQWHPPTRDDPRRLTEMIANAHRFRHRWGSWPMQGWFEEMRERGVVRFDPNLDVLDLAVAP